MLCEPKSEARIGSASRTFEVALNLGFMGCYYRPERYDWPSSIPNSNDGWMPDLALAFEAHFIVTWDPCLLDHEIPLPVEVG